MLSTEIINITSSTTKTGNPCNWESEGEAARVRKSWWSKIMVFSGRAIHVASMPRIEWTSTCRIHLFWGLNLMTCIVDLTVFTSRIIGGGSTSAINQGDTNILWSLRRNPFVAMQAMAQTWPRLQLNWRKSMNHRGQIQQGDSESNPRRHKELYKGRKEACTSQDLNLALSLALMRNMWPQPPPVLTPHQHKG